VGTALLVLAVCMGAIRFVSCDPPAALPSVPTNARPALLMTTERSSSCTR
jgi:hypothetical protein